MSRAELARVPRRHPRGLIGGFGASPTLRIILRMLEAKSGAQLEPFGVAVRVPGWDLACSLSLGIGFLVPLSSLVSWSAVQFLRLLSWKSSFIFPTYSISCFVGWARSMINATTT